MRTQTSNFLFLRQHDIQLVRLGALAERYFHDDANTCLIKLRQFGELLAQVIAAKTGLFQTGDKSQADLLRRLRFLPPEVSSTKMQSILPRKCGESWQLARMRPAARQKFDRYFTGDVNHKSLMAIYERVFGDRPGPELRS